MTVHFYVPLVPASITLGVWLIAALVMWRDLKSCGYYGAPVLSACAFVGACSSTFVAWLVFFLMR